MKLFTRKVRLFCVSNIMVSFVCTGFLGINGFQDTGSTELNAHEISLTSSDTEPASQYGEGEDNYFALITTGIKAVIDQQEDALADEVATEVKEVKKTSSSSKSKTSTKKTSTKKTTTKKSTTTNVVTKKEVSKSTTYSSGGTATGESLVAYAKKFLGLRYRTGVPSLTKGADCSGFTMLIFREYGVSLPRSVSGQAKKGSAVSKSNLQKGDLVFFKPKGCKKCGISHVAIYIGGGQVIHETRPGRGVAITKIDGLSNIQYVTARRVLTSKSAKKVEEQNKTVTDNASKTTATTTSMQENKIEGNVDNNVTSNVTATATATPVASTEVKVAATPTPTPKPAATAEAKVEVKEEKKVEVKEESKKVETTPESGE